MSRTFARLPAAIDDLRRRARDARHHRNSRKGLRDLASLDDHMLRDVGVTRGDVQFAANLPRCEDAGLALWRLSSRNRAGR